MSDNQSNGTNSYGNGPPDPNQDKNEPIGASPQKSAQAGESSRASMDQGEPPRDMATDDEPTADKPTADKPTADKLGAEQMKRSAGPPVDAGVPSPGDAQGVAVPSVQAAAGTSQQSQKVDGVKTTSIAAPGRPDGEVDTRPSAVSPNAGARPSSTSR